MAYQFEIHLPKAGIPEAIAKAELYRYINEPKKPNPSAATSSPSTPSSSSRAACSVLPSPINSSARAADRYSGSLSHFFKVCAIPTSASTTRLAVRAPRQGASS